MPTDRSQPWHIAAVTQGGRPTFARFAAGAAVGCELALLRSAGLWDVLAWVLLPARLEAVIAPLRARLDDTVPRFLARAGTRVAQVEDDPRPVWADRFGWRPLADEGEAEAVARALLRKPLRAELVERLADYPFWDSVWLGAPARPPALPGPVCTIPLAATACLQSLPDRRPRAAAHGLEAVL